MKMNYLNILVFGVIFNTLIAVTIVEPTGGTLDAALDTLTGREVTAMEKLSEIDNPDNAQLAGSSGNQNEQTWGSAIGMFNSVWGIIKDAFNPLSVTATSTSTEMERSILGGMMWFRIFYTILMIFAIIKVTKG